MLQLPRSGLIFLENSLPNSHSPDKKAATKHSEVSYSRKLNLTKYLLIGVLHLMQLRGNLLQLHGIQELGNKATIIE